MGPIMNLLSNFAMGSANNNCCNNNCNSSNANPQSPGCGNNGGAFPLLFGLLGGMALGMAMNKNGGNYGGYNNYGGYGNNMFGNNCNSYGCNNNRSLEQEMESVRRFLNSNI